MPRFSWRYWQFSTSSCFWEALPLRLVNQWDSRVILSGGRYFAVLRDISRKFHGAEFQQDVAVDMMTPGTGASASLAAGTCFLAPGLQVADSIWAPAAFFFQSGRSVCK